MRRCLMGLLMCIGIAGSYAQQQDLSFTAETEYEKHKKKYPQIEIVKPLKNSNVKEQKNIIYQRFESRELKLDAFLPVKKGKRPAVILIHGGGWKSGSKEMDEPMAQRLAAEGFAAFAVEYRLSPEAKFPAGKNDIVSAIDFIRKNRRKFNIDKKKIAVLGTSAGGQLAALIGVTSLEKVSAVINIDGILAFHHQESQEGEAAIQWLGAAYQENPEIWKEASPLFHADCRMPPVLFVNSQFTRFHAGRDDMIEIMNECGIRSEIVQIENSPHTFWLFKPWFDETMNAVIQFLNQELLK